MLMAQLHTHYDNLKVARNAPPEIIRAAYKTLSQKYHPDRNPDSPDAIRVIQIINSAYEVLSDPVKRREHDEWIARTESSEQAAPNGAGWAFLSEPEARKPSRHHARRKTAFSMRKFRHTTAWGTARLMQRVRMALDRFSRRIFSKG
jgi:DnaJ-class molecular chaperone